MSELEKPKMMDYARHMLVCVGPRCTEEGESQELFDMLGEKFKAAGIDKALSMSTWSMASRLKI